MKQSAILLPAFFMMSACMMSGAKSVEECENFYNQAVSNSSLATPLQQAQYLEKEGQECLRTGLYDVWVGLLYQEAGEADKSIQIANAALAATSEERPNLLHLIAKANLQKGNEAEAIKQAEKIAHDYPDYSPILGFLGGIAAKKEDWNTALMYSEKLYKIEKNAISLLGMAADLHQLNRHEEAVNAVYKALELEPDRIAKTTGVLEAIFSLAILNRRPEAAELAKRHIAANPNWRDNPTFAQAALELGVVQK